MTAPAAAPRPGEQPVQSIPAEGVDPAIIEAMRQQIDALTAQLQSLGAGAIAPPEPRFKSIFDLFREIANHTLSSDVLHEFLATVDTLDAEANPEPDDADADPAGSGPGAILPPGPIPSEPAPVTPPPAPAPDPVGPDGWTDAQRAAIDAEVDRRVAEDQARAAEAADPGPVPPGAPPVV